MCALLVAVTASTWVFVRVSANRAVEAVVNTDFAQAERAVRRLHGEHLNRLTLTARLVASFPELKALFTTDAATVEDFLLSFQQRFPNTPTLVAIGPEGTVLGRTDSPNASGESKPEEWLSAINRADSDGSLIVVGNRPYLAAAVSSEAAGTVFGYVVAAEAINQDYADAVSDATQDEVLLLSDENVLASTLRAEQRPWLSLKAWHAAGGRIDQFLEVAIAGQRYSAREVAISSQPAVSVIVVKSQDEARSAHAGIERGVVIIGIVAMGVLVAGGLPWRRRAVTSLHA
jgi:hypothetical protein